MQENEFEKQVRMRMDELRLVPGEDVWKKVSGRIHKEKRRRRFLIFLTVVTFLAGGSWIYFYNNTSKHSSSYAVAEVEALGKKQSGKTGGLQKRDDGRLGVTGNVKTISRNSSTATKKRQGEMKRIEEIKKTSIGYGTGGGNKKTIRTDSQKHTPLYATEVADKAGNPERKSRATLNHRSNPALFRSQSQVAKGSDTKDKLGGTPKHSNGYNDGLSQVGKPPLEDKELSELKPTDPTSEGVKSSGQVSIESAEPQKEQQQVIPIPDPKKESILLAAIPAKALLKPKEGSNKSWNLGLTLFAGLSDNLSRYGLFHSGNANFQNSSGSVSNPGIPTVTTLSYKSGFSYALGIYVRKRVTKTTGFSAGANYHFLSAVSEVGSHVISTRTFFDQSLASSATVPEYYIPGQSTRYTNKYYLVELPLNVLIQPIRNQKRPIVLTLGIAPAYLLESKALYANRSQQVYYEDHSQFKKWLFQTQVGAQFTLINKNEFDLTAGPEVRYGLSNMVKPATGAAHHLLSGGVNLNVNLK